MNQRFVDIIQSLGRTVGLNDLQPDENGYLCLTFDERAVNIEEREGTAFLYTIVGPLPTDNQEAVYRRLLSANCFYRETQGATLGVDEQLGVLLFYQTPVTTLDAAQFETILSNFVNTADAWRSRLEESRSAPAVATPSAAAGTMWA